MTRLMRWVIPALFVAAIMGVPSAMAKDKWHKIAEREVTRKGGREIPFTGDIAMVRFVVVEGSVIINGFAIRQGTGKSDFKVGRRIEKDSSVDIDVGQKNGVTGLVVSEDGQGTYRIYARF